MVGRTLVASKLLAGSACGKRQVVRPLNSVVRHHPRRCPNTPSSQLWPLGMWRPEWRYFSRQIDFAHR
jgi:hypothetical protein